MRRNKRRPLFARYLNNPYEHIDKKIKEPEEIKKEEENKTPIVIKKIKSTEEVKPKEMKTLNDFKKGFINSDNKNFYLQHNKDLIKTNLRKSDMKKFILFLKNSE